MVHQSGRKPKVEVDECGVLEMQMPPNALGDGPMENRE